MFAALAERIEEVILAVEMQIGELELQENSDEVQLAECRARLRRAQEQLFQLTWKSKKSE